jgi:hypothetical protein
MGRSLADFAFGTVQHVWGAAARSKALQRYMHEIIADRDHAMCNIQNRTIPVVQLIHFKTYPLQPFNALAFSFAYILQGVTVLRSAQARQVLGYIYKNELQWKLRQMSDSISRYLVHPSPLGLV